jgi:Recombination endonuclease VII
VTDRPAELFGELPRGKRCPDCGLWKPLDEFPKNNRTASGSAVYCKPCHNARGRESKERLYGGTRHYHLKRRYGIGADDFDALVVQQGGVCAICGKEAPEHVDHSHDTGAVRGILCFNCNGGLGQFRDSVDALVNAVAYLQSHDPVPRELDALARERAGELARTPG